MMKVPNVECARAVRDCGIDAMDALNEILHRVEEQLPPEDRRILRRTIAGAADAILTELVNPVLRDFPELDEDEDKWGAIAIEQARRRVVESDDRPPENDQSLPDFKALLRAKMPDRQ
jgi:hypothetical protein